MATLKNVHMGWKGLQDVINRIIDTVNSQTPVEGSGIRIVDTSNGKLISVAGETTSQASGGGGGGAQTAGAPMTIQAFDVNNNPVTITVMTDGLGVSASTLAWQQITVVDPSTCVQSTKPLLGRVS